MNPRLQLQTATEVRPASNFLKLKLAFLAFAMMLGFVGVSRAGYFSVPLTPGSFTYDIIVESNYPAIPSQNAITVTMDAGPAQTGNTWFELGLDLSNATTAFPYGMPHPNTLVTNRFTTSHVYRMPPTYAGNCCVFVGNYTNIPVGFANNYTTGAFVPSAPAPYNTLSFLLSGGNGPVYMSCVISYSDGSTQTNNILAADWFGAFNSGTGVYTGANTNGSPTPVEAFSALGRASTTAYTSLNSATQCVLWSLDLGLSNTVANVTNISFTWTGGGRTSIFSVSGSTGGSFSPIAVTGYDGDPIIETTVLPLPYTATMDNGTNINSGGAGANTWFEQGWDTNHPLSGFPAHGSILTSISTGRQYIMPASYTVPNATLIDTNHQTANITPITPQAFTAVSLLTAGASIGAANVMTNKIILQHADGVNETNFFLGFDWFNNNTVSAGVPVVVAYGANGRANFNAARSLQNVTNLPFLDPRMFESQFQLLDTTSPITNIVCQYFQAGGVTWTTYVIAIAGTTDPVPVQLAPDSTPAAQNIHAGQTATFGTQVLYGTAPTYQWQKGSSYYGPFSNITDGPTGTGSTITGSLTPSLTVANCGSSDVLYYTCLVTNSVTTNLQQRVPAPLTLITSTATNVLLPTDPISDTGELLASPAGLTLPGLIDGTLTTYLNYGNSGTNIAPFIGPITVTVRPQVGNTIVTAVRLVAAVNAVVCDPADFMLEGSPDGTNFTTILADTSLSISDARNLLSLYPTAPINTTNMVMQELTFANSTGYNYYRMTVNNVKTNALANSMQLAEAQLLGSLSPIAPGILTQPSPTNQVLFVGASTAYSVLANGPAPFTYQWYQNTNTPVPGGTAATLNLTNVQLGASGTYDCVISNSFGATTSSFVNLTVLARPAGYATAILNDGPIAYYRLDEEPVNSGTDGVTANDYVGGHSGSYSNVIGAIGYSTNDVDTAMAVGTQNTNFSLVGGITGINFARPTNQDGAMSVELWAQGVTTGTGFAQTSGEGLICLGFGGGGEQFTIDTGGTSNSWRFFFRDAGGTSHTVNASSFNGDGVWHHIVGVLDETNKQEFLYVDGQLAQLTALATNGMGILADNSPTNRFTIGWRNASTTNATAPSLQFSGLIDEVSLYNYPLSSNKVLAHFNAAGIAPHITLNPVSRTNNEGTIATFTGSAFGTPTLSYQWWNSDGSNPTTPLSGQTATNLMFNNVTAGQNGTYYQLVVSNAYGVSNSTPAQLTVISGPPIIFTDLQSTYQVYSGYPIVLSVVAGGTPTLTYQWTHNSTNLTDNGHYTGSQSNLLIITPTDTNDAGTYQVVVHNGQGNTPSVATSVSILPILGFNGFGNGWSSQGTGGSGLYVSSNVLQITSSVGSEANSSFFNFPVYIGGFRATWNFQVISPNGNNADGTAFVVQNDPRGASALGAGGGSMGVGAANPITPSVELEFNIYGNVASGVGISFNTDGGIGPNTFPSPVLISGGDVIGVTLTYLNGVASVTLVDSNAATTFSANASVDVAGHLGTNTAYVGFTGGDGGSVSTQQVSNFSFVSLINLKASVSGGNRILTWPSGVGGYQLQQNNSVTSAGTWTIVNAPVSVVGGLNQVTLSPTNTAQFFRLVLP